MISKKELFKYNVLWWSVIIVCLLLLICSCGSSKNIDRNNQTDYTGILQQMRSRMDSLLVNMEMNRKETSDKLSNLKVENKTVYYSIPDSTGKQYPVMVSETNANKEDKESTTIETELKITIQQLVKEVSDLKEKLDATISEKEKVTELSWWDLHKEKVYLCIIVSFIIGWLVYKKRNK